MPRTLLVLALAILALTSNAPAQQDTTGLVPGRRIRVHRQDKQVVMGTFASVDAATFAMVTNTGDSVRLPRADVQSVDVWAGTKSQTGKGALLGLAAGAVAGAGLGVVVCLEEEDCVGYIGVGALVFGAFGAGAGALIGSGSHTDRWEPTVWPTLSVLPVGPDRGMVALGMHLRF